MNSSILFDKSVPKLNKVLPEIASVKFLPGDIDRKINLSAWGIFKFVHRFGSVLTSPAESAANRLHKMSDTEKAYSFTLRIKLACFGAFTCAILIASLPAACMRGLMTKFRKPFSYSPATLQPFSKDQSSQTKKLKIMTWNTGLGMPIMSRENRLNNPADRVDAVLNMILLEQQPNVVALQEVFDEPTKEKLVRKLNKQGYDCVHSVNAYSPLAESSGLLLAVKRHSGITLEIDKIKVFKFTNLAGPDAHSNKGAVGVRVHVNAGHGKGKKLLILNTHLQASYEDHGYGNVRKEQTKALAQVIDQWVQREGMNTSVILCGDMNFARQPVEKTDTADEYQEQIANLQQGAGLFNPNEEAPRKEGSFYQLKVKRGEKAHLVNSVIDYIFLSNDLRKAAKSSRIIPLNIDDPASLPSDHCPVIQHLKID